MMKGNFKMSTTTVYECDNCGHTQLDNKQMWYITITKQHVKDTCDNISSRPIPVKKELWCRSCCVAYSMLPGKEILPLNFRGILRLLVGGNNDA